MPSTPGIQKAERQPYCSVMNAIIGGATIEPMAAPAENRLIARPRLPGGKSVESARTPPLQLPGSATPRTKRQTPSSQNDLTKPVAAVASDQTPTKRLIDHL